MNTLKQSAFGMTHVEAMKRANNEADYREWLRSMPGLHKTSGRNNSLVSIARAGIRTGRSDEQLFDEMKAAGGQPVLGDNEVRRAIAAAHRPWHRGEQHCPVVKTDGGAFIRKMLKSGLAAPLELKPLAKYGRRSERFKHIEAILHACDGEAQTLWWTGRKYDVRNRKSLRTFIKLHPRNRYAEFIIPNPMTGVPGLTGDGTQSWACKATVKAAPLVICEFDNLPPEEQLLFWSGVIATKSLDVRSLVWSGNKSYHALVKVPEGHDRAEYIAYLRSVLPGIDPAPMHPAGLSRLAGGSNERTGNVQRLVWVAP